jgi:Electron transfer DM13
VIRLGRAAICLAALAVALLVSGCGDDGDSAGDAFEVVQQQEAERSQQQREIAAPRWEPLRIFEGSGNSTETVQIDEDAIRWRASWSCERGMFELTANGGKFGSGECPGDGRWSSIDTGEIELRVSASGPWRVRVWQQVESALREPPPERIAAGAAQLLGQGRFYRIENRGQGTARLYRLPGGRIALRMEGFSTAANTDLFVWVSEDPRPRTTKQALNSPHQQIAALKSTLGDQNYLLPLGFDPAAARSVVIWCEPIQIAYTAATLAG